MNTYYMPFATDIDPSKLRFTIPDFGFSDTLNYGKEGSATKNIWQLLYDQIKKLPKYQRLHNLILELVEKKKQREQSMDDKGFLPN